MSKPTMKVTSDFTKEFNAIIKEFRHDEILVGIPQDTTARTEGSEEAQPINNATILAINNFGSPINNIPPWPVMEMGIYKAVPEMEKIFAKAAKEAFSKGLAGLRQNYERIGIIASNSIKKVINSQESAPDLADSTLTARARAGFKGTSRLIVTGQVRNAITYAVKGR